MITVENLVFDYPTQRALHGVSCHVEAGTVTGLVGPNGAGKTTLMRCMAGLEEVIEGRVTVAGIDVLAEPRRAHAQMGYLQDFFGLYDDLTVAQCLTFHAAAHEVPAGERQASVAKVAERLALADRLHQKAGTLSRGLRQRLAIAQAIIHEPTVLLLDEPASGLDPEARQSLSRLVLELRDRGMTLIVSSHILAELEDYSTHMMIVQGGHILDHEPIRPGAAAAVDGAAVLPSRRLRLGLAGADARLEAALAEEPAVAGIVATDGGASFEFAGGDAEQAALLKRLVETGLPVASLTEEQETMQERYLARVRARAAAEMAPASKVAS